jgi:protein-disulfide isomerase
MARIAIASAALVGLAGCSGGGMVDMTSMPSLSALGVNLPGASASASDSGKVKPEAKQINVADLHQPGPLGERVIGKANAPVTIVEYISLTCADCSRFQAETLPKIKKAYIDKGKVRLAVREFPVGSTATAAAIAARCISEKDYFKAVDKFLLKQKDWAGQEVKNDEIYNVVKFTGLKRDKFNACLTNQSINSGLDFVKQRGMGFGVVDSPTYFVNGKKIAGAVSFEEMQTAIEAALPNSPAGQPQAQQPQPKPQHQASANPA